MRVLLVSSHREEKIEAPLRRNNVEVISVGSYFEVVLNVLNNVIQSRGTNCAIIQGGSYLTIFSSIAMTLFDYKVIIRYGGDPWVVDKSVGQRYRKQNKYIIYLYYFMLQKTHTLCMNNMADAIIVVSNNLKYKFEMEKNIKTQIHVVNTPIFDNSLNFPSSRSISIGSYSTNILTVTNLRFQGKLEGLKDSVEYLAPVLRGNEEVKYYIAGGGWYLSDLIEYIAEFDGIRNQIVICGYVEDINRLYSKADIFLYHTYIDAYPSVILEAQQWGLPIVANPKFGITEQIDSGRNGYLCTSENTSEVISYLIDDREARLKIGNQAKQDVRTRNSPYWIGQSLLSVISKLEEKDNG